MVIKNMESIDIQKFTLSKCPRDVVLRMKDVFRKSFPDNWTKCIPFPDDTIYVAMQKTKLPKVAGFCMVHDTPPYKFSGRDGDQRYMYNLCVDPRWRKCGIATKILQTLQRDYPLITSHMKLDDPYHDWFTKRGWYPIGTWRQTYTEYMWPPPKSCETSCPPVKQVSPNYDPEENIIYLS
jgi:hypothetical protein